MNYDLLFSSVDNLGKNYRIENLIKMYFKVPKEMNNCLRLNFKKLDDMYLEAGLKEIYEKLGSEDAEEQSKVLKNIGALAMFENTYFDQLNTEVWNFLTLQLLSNDNEVTKDAIFTLEELVRNHPELIPDFVTLNMDYLVLTKLPREGVYQTLSHFFYADVENKIVASHLIEQEAVQYLCEMLERFISQHDQTIQIVKCISLFFESKSMPFDIGCNLLTRLAQRTQNSYLPGDCFECFLMLFLVIDDSFLPTLIENGLIDYFLKNYTLLEKKLLVLNVLSRYITEEYINYLIEHELFYRMYVFLLTTFQSHIAKADEICEVLFDMLTKITFVREDLINEIITAIFTNDMKEIFRKVLIFETFFMKTHLLKFLSRLADFQNIEEVWIIFYQLNLISVLVEAIETLDYMGGFIAEKIIGPPICTEMNNEFSNSVWESIQQGEMINALIELTGIDGNEECQFVADTAKVLIDTIQQRSGVQQE